MLSAAVATGRLGSAVRTVRRPRTNVKRMSIKDAE